MQIYHQKLGHRKGFFLSLKCYSRLHHTVSRNEFLFIFPSFLWLACRFVLSLYISDVVKCTKLFTQATNHSPALAIIRIVKLYAIAFRCIQERLQVTLHFWSGKMTTTTLYACFVFVFVSVFCFLWAYVCKYNVNVNVNVCVFPTRLIATLNYLTNYNEVERFHRTDNCANHNKIKAK